MVASALSAFRRSLLRAWRGIGSMHMAGDMYRKHHFLYTLSRAHYHNQSTDQARTEAIRSTAILKKLATPVRQLAELKGVSASIPNQGILIYTLGLQEAEDSSAIENIVTTHDELFRDAAFPERSRSFPA
jgi:hypothetical protein